MFSQKKYCAKRGIYGINVSVEVTSRGKHCLERSDNFDWGCNSKGSKILAKSILTDFFNVKIANKYYQDFAKDFIFCLPMRGFIIPGRAISEWLENKIGGQARSRDKIQRKVIT